jgi:DNA-binding NtrC family response regulator
MVTTLECEPDCDCSATAPETNRAILFVSPLEEDHGSLRKILHHAKWEIHDAYSYREALACLHVTEIGVVITERDLPGHCWQDLLDTAAKMCHGPNLVVSSRFADERLWAEVLNLGGYDVLYTPFEASEAMRVISLAWQQWDHRRAKPTQREVAKAAGVVARAQVG